MSSVTSACSSSSSSAAMAPIEPASTDEVADEVKVFRTNDAEESMDIASSSAELNADKKDLALEAEIESQTEPIAVAQRMLNPLQSAAMNFPSPSYDFLFPLFMPSPLSPIQAYAATAAAAAYTAVQASQNPLLKMCSASMSPNVAAVANAAQHLAAAAAFARHSPNYLQLGGGWNPLAPPAFGVGSPTAGSLLQHMSQAQQAHNGFNTTLPHYQHAFQQPQAPHLNSPLTSVSSAINGMTLADQQRKQQQHQLQQQQRSASNQQHAGHTNQTPKAKKSKSAPSSSSKQPTSRSAQGSDQSGKDKGHVKKPCNAFMWYMKVNRAKLLAQEDCQQKQSALLNQKLGKMWQSMSKKDQQPYYDMAANEREEHQQLLKGYPNWTARENYAIHKKNKNKKKREKSMENNEQKKCRARFGVENQAQWCKHCRRKKRCLNVRDSDSPVMVSSTSGGGVFHQAPSVGTSHLSALHHPSNFYDMTPQSAFLASGSASMTTAHSSALSSPYSSSSAGAPTTGSSKRSESNYSSESAAATVNCTPPLPPQNATCVRAIKMDDSGDVDEEQTPKATKNNSSSSNCTPTLPRPSPYRPQIAESFQQMLNLPFGGGMVGRPSAGALPSMTTTTGYLAANPPAQ